MHRRFRGNPLDLNDCVIPFLPELYMLAGHRGDPAMYNLQPKPMYNLNTSSPRPDSSGISEVQPVTTCDLSLASMQQRGITRWRVGVRPRTETRLSMHEGDAVA